MAVEFYKESRMEAIEAFLDDNFSAPTHWPEWNIVVSEYFKTGFFYWVCSENGEIIGICPVHKQNNLFTIQYATGPREFLLPFGGWIFKRSYNFTSHSVNLSIAQALTGFTLPCIDEFHVTYSNIKKNDYCTIIVDLRKELDRIWQEDISSKRRNMVRKAEKNNVRIVIDDKKDLSTFHSYLKNANIEYGLGTPENIFFERLFLNSRKVKFDILWAIKDNSILGGLVLAMDKNYALYWLGIGIKESGNFGQGELLQWHAIQNAKRNGCSYYDLCSVEKERLPNIYEFKKDFSRWEVHNYFLNEKTFSYRLINKLEGLLIL